MPIPIADQIDALAQDAAVLVKNLRYYWDEEGVSDLGIFIDPDLFQYLDKLYHESLVFAERCQKLGELAGQLRNA
jgi:hypothetical protein